MDTSTFAYIDQSWSPAQNCDTVIESLNKKLDMHALLNENKEPSEARKLMNELTDLKNELYSYLQGNLIVEDKYETEDFKETRKNIDASLETVASTMAKFKEQRDKVRKLEDEYHRTLQVADTSISKVTDFIDFLHVLDVKHGDIAGKDITDIIAAIKRLGDAIRSSTKVKTTQQAYETELYTLKYYLQHFIKPLNGGNMGSTCSLCLQKPVDTFLDPCGHTGCSGCIEKVHDEYDSNCFICRVKIARSRKIYFS
jgi:transcriptional regulator with PAS, ATPase and Fis domain